MSEADSDSDCDIDSVDDVDELDEELENELNAIYREFVEAIRSGDKAKARALFASDKRKAIANKLKYENVLRKEVLEGSLKSVGLLIEFGAVVSPINGDTPFKYAVFLGENEIARFLAAKGAFAELNAKDSDGNTMLHLAARHGPKRLLETLLFVGSLVNDVNNNGETALHYAVESGNKDVVEMLIRSGAKVNIRAKDGETPIGRVVKNSRLYCDDNMDIAKLFIDSGWDIDSALFSAIHNESDFILRQLIELGADVNARSTNGNTVLHAATLLHKVTDNIKVVETLIQNGADVNGKDDFGMTVLHLAALVGAKEIAEMLISKGVNINPKDNRGGTPLDYTCIDVGQFVGTPSARKAVSDLLRRHGATKNNPYTLSNVLKFFGLAGR